MGTFLLPLSCLVLVFTLKSIGGAGAGQDDEHCRVKRCNKNGPIIRFPFRLKDQPDHCGYPGFELSCSQYGTILEYHHPANTSIKGLQLSYSIKEPVDSIDYKSQRIYFRRGWKIQVHSSAAANSPPYDLVDLTFFNCSSRASIQGISQNLQVYYVIDSTLSTLDVPMIYCTKMHNATILSPDDYESEGSLHLSWSTPVCRNCESKGEYCKLASNSNTSVSTTTTCFPIPKPPGLIAAACGQLDALLNKGATKMSGLSNGNGTSVIAPKNQDGYSIKHANGSLDGIYSNKNGLYSPFRLLECGLSVLHLVCV